MRVFGWKLPLRPRVILSCLLLALSQGLEEDASLNIVQESSIGSVQPTAHKCYVFLHLQKAGGSTVKKIVKQRWGNRHVLFDALEWREGKAYTQDFARNLTIGKDWDVAVGGYAEALRPSTGKSCKWFTVFRHPISRMVSAYFYCRKSKGDQLCAKHARRAEDMTLVEFAEHWGNFGVRQFALSSVEVDEVYEFVRNGGVVLENDNAMDLPGWYLVKKFLDHKGHLQGGDESTVLFGMLQEIRDSLHEDFAVVGILEKFEETLELFNNELKMPHLDWKANFRKTGIRNVDSVFLTEKEQALELAWTNSEIKSYINVDLLLYEHAVDVFEEMLRHRGLAY